MVRLRQGAARDLRLGRCGGESSRTLPVLQFLAQIARDNVRSARIDTVWHNKPKVRDSWESRLNDIFCPVPSIHQE